MSRPALAASLTYSLIALTDDADADAVAGHLIPADHSQIPATDTVSFEPDTVTFLASGSDENVNRDDVG
jgi:hypothetical protein